MTRYPERQLGEVLELELDRVDVVVTDSYPLAGVYSFGRGLFAREPLAGSDTSYMTLNRLHEGMFVMSRLKAFEGAVAVVPAALDGYHLSQEFPTFAARGKADPRYLHYLTRWPEFWDRLARTSKGLGSRRERVHPEQLLSISVPLPDGGEQSRIADRLDSTSHTIDALAERHGRDTQLAAALEAAFVTDDAPRVRLGELLTQIERATSVLPAATYQLIGARWYAGGLFVKAQKYGSEISAARLYRLEAGDFVYNRLFAWKGSFALATQEHHDCYVSGEFPTFQVQANLIEPQYLLAFFKRPGTWDEALSGSAGSTPTSRNRLKAEKLLEMSMPLPSLSTQKKVVKRLRMLDDVQTHFERRHTHLEALPLSFLSQAFDGEL